MQSNVTTYSMGYTLNIRCVQHLHLHKAPLPHAVHETSNSVLSSYLYQCTRSVYQYPSRDEMCGSRHIWDYVWHQYSTVWKTECLITFARKGNSVARDLPSTGSKANTTKQFYTPPPFPRKILFSKNVGNSIQREENFHHKFKQHSINIKNYTVHPHDMVHIPAKFSSYSAKTKRDGQTDIRMDRRGAFQYLPSRAFGER